MPRTKKNSEEKNGDLFPIIGDVILTQNGGIGVVMDIKEQYPKNPVIYRTKAGRTQYKAPRSFVSRILGNIGLEGVRGLEEEVNQALPELCKGLPFESDDGVKYRPGDRVLVRVGGEPVPGIFRGFNPRRPKYSISFEVQGKLYKGTEGVLISLLRRSEDKGI